jgi:hypothetical protein
MANGRLYALNFEGFPKLDGKLKKQIVEFKGQAKIVFDAMALVRKPRSIVEIAKAVEAELVTTQTALKVVTFYVVKWRAEGIVKMYAAAADDASVEEAFDKLVASIAASDEDIDEDEGE